MEPADHSNPMPSNESTRPHFDKNEVIKVLQQLINDHPSDVVPSSVVEEALAKVIGSRNLNGLQDDPALKKLEQTLTKARSKFSS